MSETKRIRRVFIANRGEIAARIIRTCRALGIEVAVAHSEADADAPFVEAADIAVELSGSTSAETYLRADLLVDAARRTRSDAVHPGYGFLAENADFAAACEHAGLTFLGPTPDVIARMGSKLEAKALLSAAGVPVLSTIDGRGLENAELAERAQSMGLPLLLKADLGGGGKAMHVVRDFRDLPAAIETARRESASAFGDDGLFIEPFVERPRHIEIQVLADIYGRAMHLFERECSVQRRHQKVVEEAPSTVVSSALREEMGAAAVAGAEAIGYRGVGTFEFLLTPDGHFFFLEVNTRLQVEHPVTELVTGIDLVAAQIQLACGASVDDVVRERRIDGHAVEARLYAEDPASGYLPQTGTFERFEFDTAPGIRVDAGVRTGSVVTPHYDPMIAKVIGHGATRDEAIDRLSAALRRARVSGVRTNRDFLVRVLESDEFRSGDIDTQYLDRHESQSLTAPLVAGEDEGPYALAAVLSLVERRRRTAPVLRGVAPGWRNNPSQLNETRLSGATEHCIGYRIEGGSVQFDIDGTPGSCRFNVREGQVALQIDGVWRRFQSYLAGDRTLVAQDVDGSVTFSVIERLPKPGAGMLAPGAVMAPMPGLVLQVVCDVGDEVAEGQLLAILEAMKMENRVQAKSAGTVSEVLVKAGQQVVGGDVLLVIEEHQP